MGYIGKSKIFKHQDGGGQIHIPKPVWDLYDMEDKMKIQWWVGARYEELAAETDDVIVLVLERKKQK